MKTVKTVSLFFFVWVVVSCSSVRVASDYDKTVDYNQYKTFAFYKDGIDKVEIHDLDKKRILKAIERELNTKGMTTSDNPDLLVNIFTEARERVDVNRFHAGWGYGWGWGWNPWVYGGSYTSVSRATEGSLYIDLIDARKKELVWQGMGEGVLTKNIEKKEERINEFVNKILAKFPPNSQK